MAKKFKFTDLAYDEVKPNTEIKQTKEILIDDLKEQNKKNETKDNINSDIVKNSDIEFEQNISENVEKKEKIINYDIDYSEYDNDDKEIKKDEKDNNISSNLGFSQNSTRTQLRTYSSVLEEKELSNHNYKHNLDDVHQNLSGTMASTFSPNKIKDLISFKEKLDIKTNIYLKSSIVIKLKELEKRTNESRSSIINKLLEYAIKSMEEN